MKHSISPYPETVRVVNIPQGAQIFNAKKYLGEIQHVRNWGTDWLARPEDGRKNQFFATKTEAVRYMIEAS